jgi:tetratricopeptide (TPR) repeat protein
MENQFLLELSRVPDDALAAWLRQRQAQLSSETVAALRAWAEEVGYDDRDLDGALHILDRAEAVASRLADPLAMGIVWRGRASVLQRHDRFEESLVASGQAAALYQAQGTPLDVAIARVVEVYTLGALERFDEAIALAQRIRQLFVREGLVKGEAYVAANLAQVYTWVWRHEDALREYRRARRLFLALGEPVKAAEMLNDLGVLAEQMDRLALARRYYTRAYPALVAAGDVFRMVKNRYNLALLCLRQERYEEALAHFAQARADLARLPDSPDAAYVDLFEARVRRLLNQRDQARQLLEGALARFESLGRHIESAEALLDLGRLLGEQDTPDGLADGVSCLERAEEYLQHANVPLLLAATRLAQGEFLLRLHRPLEAALRAEPARDAFGRAGLTLRRAQAEALLGDCTRERQPDDARRCYQSALAAAVAAPGKSRAPVGTRRAAVARAVAAGAGGVAIGGNVVSSVMVVGDGNGMGRGGAGRARIRLPSASCSPLLLAMRG